MVRAGLVPMRKRARKKLEKRQQAVGLLFTWWTLREAEEFQRRTSYPVRCMSSEELEECITRVEEG